MIFLIRYNIILQLNNVWNRLELGNTPEVELILLNIQKNFSSRHRHD